MKHQTKKDLYVTVLHLQTFVNNALNISGSLNSWTFGEISALRKEVQEALDTLREEIGID